MNKVIGRFKPKKYAFKLPANYVKAFEKEQLLDRQIIIGIRPENVKLEGLYGDGAITGEFKISELMGADRYIYLDIGETKPIVMRGSANYYFTSNEKVNVVFDMSLALFFYYDSGARVIEV